MAGSIGTTTLSGISIGSTEILKASLGTTILWESGGGGGASLGNVGNGQAEEFSSASDGSLPGFAYTRTGAKVAAIVAGYRASSDGITLGVDYGATAMDALGPVIWGNNNSGSNSSFVQWFELASPPSGEQTITAWWDADGSAAPFFAMNIVSFDNVATIAGPTYDYGTESGTSMSQDVSSATGEIVLQCFMRENLSVSSDYPTRTAGETVLFRLNCGYGRANVAWKPGASTVNFAGTRLSGADYSESAIRLQGA